MKTRRSGAVATIFLVANMSFVQAAEVVVEYAEALQQLTFSPQTDSTANQKIDDELIQAMSFNAFGRNFQIQLYENHPVVSAAENSGVTADIGVYRGTVAGDNDSWVRLTVARGEPRGLLLADSEMYAIDNVDGRTSIFLLADMHIANGEMICSQNDDIVNAGEFVAGIITEVQQQTAVLEAQGAVTAINLAVMADTEFVEAKGSNAESEVLTRMNNVDGIFSAQLGVQLNVNRLDLFSSETDPFSEETGANALLTELADFRVSTTSQWTNGLSHLLTARNLNGSTVGIAYGGTNGAAICSRQYGAGLTQATHSATFDSLIVAHELGHNFGAPHDGTDGSACESEPQDYLMAPTLNGSDEFSDCSISQMQAVVDIAGCLKALPSTDVSVIAEMPTRAALLGDSADIRFALGSNGTDAITNVVITVALPPEVVLDAMSSSTGTCTSGAANVTCSLGTLPAGSGASVTVTVGTPAIGAADITATVTGDGDANANNNQASTQLTISPAVDLAVVSDGVAAAMPGENATIRTLVENRADHAATDVTLTITPAAGITIDSTSWAPGSCSISNNVATCQAQSVAPQSGADLVWQFKGDSSGIYSYSISAAASEADRDRSNDSINGQINVGNVVVPPPSSTTNEASGGGGVLSLWALLLALLVRHRVTTGQQCRMQHKNR